MDHVVYLDAQAKELDNMLKGSRTMQIRGTAGRKLSHGCVYARDVLDFVNNDAEKMIQFRGIVTQAFHTDKITETESLVMISKNQPKLCLTEKQLQRWGGKRYKAMVGPECLAWRSTN